MSTEDDLFKAAENLLADIKENNPESSDHYLEVAKRALYWAIYDQEPYWTD